MLRIVEFRQGRGGAWPQESWPARAAAARCAGGDMRVARDVRGSGSMTQRWCHIRAGEDRQHRYFPRERTDTP